VLAPTGDKYLTRITLFTIDAAGGLTPVSSIDNGAVPGIVMTVDPFVTFSPDVQFVYEANEWDGRVHVMKVK
jgi:hypothetical protein